MIGVAGCVAQAEGEEISRREPAVDVVLGPRPITACRRPCRRRVWASVWSIRNMPSKTSSSTCRIPPRSSASPFRHRLPHRPGRLRQVLHLLRCALYPGSEVSRPLSQLLTEARKLVDSGVRELTLLGQNVNAWHGEDEKGRAIGLGDLLYRLAEIPALPACATTTSHPRDMDDRLIEAHRDLRMLMPYLHLPVQSGSDRILKR